MKRKALKYEKYLELPLECIYDAYAIVAYGWNAMDKGVKAELYPHVLEIKKVVLQCFKDLMKKQINKYVPRGRIKQEFVRLAEGLTQQSPAEDYFQVLDHSTRFDLVRKNKLWAAISKRVWDLERESDPGQIIMILVTQGGVYNLVHNRGPLLEKFSNGPALLQAFERCSNAKIMGHILSGASDFVRDAVKHSVRKDTESLSKNIAYLRKKI